LIALRELDALHRGLDGFRAPRDPGVGVRVESLELAGVAVEPQEDDRLRRLPGPLGLVGQEPPDRRQPAQPGQLEEIAAVESRPERKMHRHPQWFQENSVMLISVQQRSLNLW